MPQVSGHTREVLSLCSHNSVFSVRQTPSGLDTLVVMTVLACKSNKKPTQTVSSNSKHKKRPRKRGLSSQSTPRKAVVLSQR